MPHPATLFLLLTLAVVFLSWLFDAYGVSTSVPGSGMEVSVQSLLRPEGIRWWLRNIVPNFTGFAPLGQVIIAMFGIGVAQHSGLVNACIRRCIHYCGPGHIIGVVILLGLLSNVAGDAGYVILLPVGAMLFHAVGLHPVGGILTAYISVACGYSANLFLCTLDSALSAVTQEAADASSLTVGRVGPLCNYYFLAASVLLLFSIIYTLVRRSLLPALGHYEGAPPSSMSKPLSRKERRALSVALVAGGLYAALVLWATFSSWGILRGVNGGLMRSPFMEGILFLLSFGIGLSGMLYGFASGRYHTDEDVVGGLMQSMRLLGSYFVIAFFASQMFACLDYTQLNKCLAIMGTGLLASVQADGLSALLLLILSAALVNLLVVSAAGKWAFMSLVFIPLSGGMGIPADVVQCAYRIGDSATNALTPFLFYMPLVLACLQQYDREASYGFLLKYTWKFSLLILLAWSLLFAGWYACGLPFGL